MFDLCKPKSIKTLTKFLVICMEEGRSHFVNGQQPKGKISGRSLCEKHCIAWRRTHEMFAKRAFSMGWDQAEIDFKVAAGELE